MASSRKAIRSLANSLTGDTLGLPNRAVIQRMRHSSTRDNPNDQSLEATAVLLALKRKAGKRGKKKGR